MCCRVFLVITSNGYNEELCGTGKLCGWGLKTLGHENASTYAAARHVSLDPTASQEFTSVFASSFELDLAALAWSFQPYPVLVNCTYLPCILIMSQGDDYGTNTMSWYYRSTASVFVRNLFKTPISECYDSSR